jgi:filamentous hemagglutinin family protein
VSTGAATAVQTGNSLSVTQTSSTATLNWSSFNIGAAGKVAFQQPSSSSIALNRIFDANPSSIFGTLTANGQIYLVNANGFLFGSGAVVNVGGLLASSLNLSDKTFAAGILTPGSSGLPALTSTDNSGNSYTAGNVTVQVGATLTAADQGRVLLAAPNVTNGGTLSAPDGQVILAAGQSLILTASDDPKLRGLLVQIDGGGSAANSLSGGISAARGNVTLAGLMVNQDGRVSATTSVNANGSIVLEAYDSKNAGTVELGPGSLTEVTPEYTDATTAVAAQTQLQSSISIAGQKVLMHGATIDAPSGALSVVAAADPSLGVTGTDDPNAEIRIDPGTKIDLAGSDAELPMSANLVTVQLRSNQLADDPTQRGGALQSTPTNTVTVTVDVRADGGKGTPIADVSSAIAAVGQNIAQRTEAGGSVAFLSEGDVMLSSGASINVSGGYTTYLGGTIQTTKLVGANGQLYDIGTANPLLTYKGIVNPTFTETYNKWGIQDVIPTPGLSEYESTYVQGAAAGSVQFAAPSMMLAGSLQATAVSGPYQRGSPPAGGTLIIGEPYSTAIGNYTDYLAPSVSFSNSATPIVVADGTPLPVATLQLPTSYVTTDGVATTQIYSNTSIMLPSGLPLVLTPGASLSLVAPRIDVDSSITAVDGNLSFASVQTSVSPIPTTAGGPFAERPGIGIGDGVTLDVSGHWTNDTLLADGVGTAPTLQNGGSVKLSLSEQGSELVLGNNVSLKADGGAWLESGGTVAYGEGGSITLDASPADSALQFGQGLAVQGFGTGTASGGAFTLLAPRIDISKGSGGAWSTAQRVDDLTSTTGDVLQLYAPLFSNYGFSSVNLTATGAVESYATNDVLTVAAGTTINAQTSTLQLDSNYFSAPSGASLAAFTAVNLLPLNLRPTSNVSLAVLRKNDDIVLGNSHYGLLDVQAGASIIADPGATISLAGEGGVVVSGTLRAPGGTIDVSLPNPIAVAPQDTSYLTDPGYQSALAIDVAPSAVLDATGTTVMTPNSQRLLTGTLLPGGSVSLVADRGTVVVEAGSSIDIAGTSAMLDVPNAVAVGGTTREVVASAGGALLVSSPESISLLGNLHAAAGIGNSGSAAAGSLELDLVQGGASEILSGPAYPAGTLEIELVDSTAGNTPSAPSSNRAVLGVEQLVNSGIDALTLRAGGTGTSPHSGNIEIDTGQLALARQLILDAPSFTIQASADLSAPYVEIGNSVPNVGGSATVVPTPYAGTGTLTVSAQQMVLLGNFAFQGASSVTLSSAGDVQLEGTTNSSTTGPTVGSILTSGSLAVDALRVYPDTYTDFSITSVKGSAGTVSIGSTGVSPGTPLSADGGVSISADEISIAGTVYAPFGSIDLTANDSLTLAKGSLISVSGGGLDIPFGQTELNQGEWIYTVGAATAITAVPTKQISLSAPNIAIQSGATANITGGGDLYAYEWVPGTGGSVDNLSATASSYPNLYAILPATKGQAGPYDPAESADSIAGQTIFLSGGAGVAAGYYTLLPARYALEKGAVLIQLEPSYLSASTGQIGALANGVPVVAGYLSTGSTGLHAGGLTEYEGVAIYPKGYAEKLAAYAISDASTFFGAIATAAGGGAVSEPADAGTLNISVTPAAMNSLDLQGSVLTAAASGGRGALVNLSAPDLEITSGSTTSGSAALAVSGSILQSWNASSLTLGGTATSVTATAGTTATDSSGIAVVANSVTVDSGVQLSADQIVLVAQQSIDVQSGAALLSTSGKNGTVLSTLPAVNTITLTDPAGDALPQGALLAVSDLYLPVVARTGLNGTAGASISLAQGATLSSGGALSVDAPGDIELAGTLNGKGASWSLSSSNVAFVGSGTSTDTLNINSGILSALQTAGALRISSQGDIDIDSSVLLGVNTGGSSPTLTSLTLIANSINNQAGGDSVFGGESLTLAGDAAVTATSAAPTVAAGTGNLNFTANTLTLGPGALSVNGFALTTAQVAGAVQTQQSGGTTHVAGFLNVGGNLTINAAEINPAADANDEPGTTIAASGTLTLGVPTAVAAGSKLPTLIGGSLTLKANDIEDAAKILAPAGIVELDSAGSIHLASTASIDTSGTSVAESGQSAVAPGGLVVLNAGGNLTLDSGSAISVAGSAGAPAGTLNISAPGGLVNLSSSLSGAASGNLGGLTTGGSLAVDAGSLVGGLAGLVATPGFGGFTEAVNIRVRSGDLDLPNSGTINANNITLTADGGTVDIAGTLTTDERPVGSVTPTAAQRGSIDLSGGTAVVLESTGQLHADGSGSNGRGGEIALNSLTSNSNCGYGTLCASTGSIVLNFGPGGSGSQISMSGAGTGQAGELILRSPVSSAGDDVNITVNAGPGGQGLGSAVSGQVVVEPVMVSVTSSSSANGPDGDLANAVANASNFLSTNGQSIAARLGVSSTAVQAGVELRDYSTGDSLVFQQPLDLTQYSDAEQQSGNPNQIINLTVRAAGSITVEGTITDGVTAPGSGYTLVTGTTPESSGSLSFVAGSDLTSANPLSVLSASTSTAALTLGPQAVVATGTASINLAAAGNVVFGYGSGGGGATVYTAGYAVAPVGQNNDGLVQNYPTDGGNVLILAGGDVLGAPLAKVDPANGDYSVTGWQTRGTTRVSSTESTGNYGVNFDNFDWNVGALGGGDVTVLANGKVSNLSAATAASSPDGNTTIYGAGGGLRITAVGDIVSSQVYVADGVGTVTTNAGLTASAQGANGVSVGSSFALGDAQISVWARQSVQVDAVYNPTFVPESSVLVGAPTGFFTYGSDSTLNLSSTDGNVTLNTEASAEGAAGQLLGLKVVEQSTQAFEDLPATLAIQSLQADVDLNGTAALYPSSEGQLVLFAGRDINGDSAGIAGGAATIAMSDSAAVPTAENTAIGLTRTGLEQGYLAEFQGALHVGDTQSALITAGRDILNLSPSIPKAATIEAGRDIVNLNYQGQNLAASDTTLITAGRDISYLTASGGIAVGGPGSVDIFAGRNVDLGISQGITTIGDLENANLATAAGADLTLAVGYGSQGANYSSFLSNIIAPSTAYQSELISFVEAQTGDTSLAYAQAQTMFTGFTRSVQTALIDDVFFNELLLSGRAANSGSGVGFAEGYAAIDALYPYSRNPTSANPDPYSGNLNMIYSQIYTLSGGNISVLVPGGTIDVGLAFTPTGVETKPAGSLGIVAEGTGNIDIYSAGDVNVNASRIFTLGGGNILIWSDEGSIDAGNGSKSSLSVPPPTILVKSDGSISIDYSGSLEGSGIRTIQTNPATPAGDVDLDAPVGTVDAGDAGIGAAGNVNIAAAHVIGALNINFGGTATGVPSDLSGLGASLSGVSAVASSATSSSTSSVTDSNAAKETAPLAQTALSWLEVFVTGLGDENCKQDDLECLRRQKKAAP